MNDSDYLDWIESQFTPDEMAEIEQANNHHWLYFESEESK